ncbi:HET-domain-containing protein [Daldinia eschscholtzii]|nr:HET-domain-containing protein [Daldinia eschscholtzii]
MDHFLERDSDLSNEHSKSPNPLLCLQCQDWDDINLHGSGSCIQNKMSVEELSQNSQCLICQAALIIFNIRRQAHDVLRSWPDSQIFIEVLGPLYLDAGYTVHRELDLSNQNSIPIHLVLRLTVRIPKDGLEVINKHPSLRFTNPGAEQRTLFTITPQFCFYYSFSDTSHLCKIGEWAVPFFDVSTIKSWIRGCDTIHGSKCAQPPNQTQFPPGFRVIDVVNMNIIEPVTQIRYVALSYMWNHTGNSHANFQLEMKNVKDLEVSGSLNQANIPKVITDAISLCRDLEELYLWIDRLCIIQDDVELKPAQLAAMDNIYRSATFTIAVALNSPNGDGLPGYRERPRDPHSSIWRPPYDADVETRGINPNGIKALVNSSLWNRRGWTFQERLLSRRCLFITEHQVMFRCSQAEASEELTWSPQGRAKHDWSTTPNTSLIDEDKIYQVSGYFNPGPYSIRAEYTVKDTASLIDYCEWVKDYMLRQLSYGTDIINAFTGVANTVSKLLACPILYGLPERYLPQCLLWSCSGESGRRGEVPEIPSWSWATSLSPVSYDWIGQNNNLSKDALEIASLVYFYYQDPACGLRKLETQEQWIHHEITIEEVAGQTELPVLTYKKLPTNWKSSRDWENCPHNPSQVFLRQALDAEACRFATMFPGALVFNTTVASLGIDFRSRASPEKDHNSQDASICHEDETVGRLNMMSFEWINTRRTTPGNRKLFDFIVICGALQPLSTRKMSSFLRLPDQAWQLHVMLVERLVCKPFVARRVDVGTISMRYWKQCKPRWETVVLC